MKYRTISFSPERLELRSEWTPLNWLIPMLFVGFVTWMFNNVLSWKHTFLGVSTLIDTLRGMTPLSADTLSQMSAPFMVVPIFTLLLYNVISLGLKEKRTFPKSLVLTTSLIRYKMGDKEPLEFNADELIACGFTTLASGKRADVYFFQFPQMTLCLPIDPQEDLDSALKTFYKRPAHILSKKRALHDIHWEDSKSLPSQKKNFYYLSGLMTLVFTTGMLILLKSRELELGQSMATPFYFILILGAVLAMFNVWLARKTYPSKAIKLSFPGPDVVKIYHEQRLEQELKLPQNAQYCILPELGYLGWFSPQADVDMPHAKGHLTTYYPTNLRAHQLMVLYNKQLKTGSKTSQLH